MNSLLKFLFITFLSGCAYGFASPQSGHETPQVKEKLFNSNGLDLQKVRHLGRELQRRKAELRSSIENDSHQRLGHSFWDSKDLSRTSYPIPFYDQALQDLKKLPEVQNEKEQYRLAHKILLLNQGVKVLGDNGPQLQDLDTLWGDLTRYTLHRDNKKTNWKASDLSSLGHNPFETPSRKAAEVSIPKDLEIKRIKTNTHHVVFELESPSNQRPLSLRVGPGIYSEATTSTLMRKMGINSYPSQVFSNVTTTIEDMDLSEFKHQYALVHSENGPDFDKLVKEIQETKEGIVITWHHALLVQHQKIEDYVGAWSPFENDLLSSPFVRSLPLFYLWVGQQAFSRYKGRDLYLEQSENSSLEYRLSFYQSGLDRAFGKSLPETPGDFPWKMVRSKDSESVKFNHRIEGLSHYPIHFEETKLMAEKILSLSREDIKQAVQSGGWPESIQRLLTEKLINRRNQLIDLYSWRTHKTQLRVDKNITTDDARVVDGELRDGIFIHDQQDFEGGILKKLAPYLEGLGHFVYKSGREILSSFNGLDIAPIELGIDDGLIKRVLFGYNRSIERNESPTGPDDQYLVKDTFKIGFRLGGGLVVSGDVSYVKEYTLIYPVKSRADGELQNKFILNLLLPYQVHADKLPEKHVLVLSDSIEGRGRLKIGNTMSVIGQSVSFSQINLGRTYVSQKTPERAYVFSDSSLFSEFAYKISLELGTLGIPVFQHRFRQGTLSRHYYELDLNQETHREALRKIKLFNSTSRLEKIGHVHKIDDTFYESNRRSNYFDFFQSESRTRYDDIIEHHEDDPHPDDTTLVRRLQLEQFKRKSWSIFNKNEEFKSQILLRASPTELEVSKGQGLEGIERPHIELQLFIEDLNTETFEFEQYIEMINDIARDPKFIHFTPSLHSRNSEWGELNVAVNMDLNQRGLEKLMQAHEKDYWRALAKVTKRPVSYWARALSTNLRNRRHLEIRTKDTYLATQLKSLAKHLRNVERERGDLWRMRSLHAAFARAIYTSGQAYRSTILAVIHEIVGTENIFLEAMIHVPPDQESHLPGKRPLYNKMGSTKDQGHPFYQFYFDQASQVYNAF